MRKYAPDAEECIAYGIPAWRINNIVAVLSPTKKDLTFAFSRGAELKINTAGFQVLEKYQTY